MSIREASAIAKWNDPERGEMRIVLDDGRLYLCDVGGDVIPEHRQGVLERRVASLEGFYVWNKRGQKIRIERPASDENPDRPGLDSPSPAQEIQNRLSSELLTITKLLATGNVMAERNAIAVEALLKHFRLAAYVRAGEED